MTTSPAQVLQTLLANPRDVANVKSVTTPDVTYVSLNEDNPELKQSRPVRNRLSLPAPRPCCKIQTMVAELCVE